LLKTVLETNKRKRENKTSIRERDGRKSSGKLFLFKTESKKGNP